MKLSKEEKTKRLLKRQQEKYNKTHKINDEGIIEKQCSICLEWLPCNGEYFYKNKSSNIDKLSPYCKKCAMEKAMEWNKNNRDKVLLFKKKNNLKPKNIIRNRLCSEKRRLNGEQKKWQQEHPEKAKEYNQRYSHKKHNISIKEWESCKEYFQNENDEYICCYCGMTELEAKKKYNNKLHKEHADCNGANDLSNCIPACKGCNDSKHQDNLEEWYKKQSFFNEIKLIKIHKWLNEDYKKYIIEKKSKIKNK